MLGNLIMPFVSFLLVSHVLDEWMRHSYMSMSSVGMVLAVEVGLSDGIDSMSVFIIQPS